MGKQPAIMGSERAARQGYETLYLAAWRHCAQLTMAGLAELAGLHMRTVYHAEHKKRTPEPATVNRLAAALGVPVDILLMCPPSAEEAREYALDVAYRAATRRLQKEGVTLTSKPGISRALDVPAQSSASDVPALVGTSA